MNKYSDNKNLIPVLIIEGLIIIILIISGILLYKPAQEVGKEYNNISLSEKIEINE